MQNRNARDNYCKLVVHPYQEVISTPEKLPRRLVLADHLNGFDQHFYNPVLDSLDKYAGKNQFRFEILGWQPVLPVIKDRYKNLTFIYEHRDAWCPWHTLLEYNTHPPLNYRNFACSFNGADHVSRQLLVAIMNRFGWFKFGFATKNFTFDSDMLHGHLKTLVPDQIDLYYKMFADKHSDVFFKNTYGIDYNQITRSAHDVSIKILEKALTRSFVHIVSETRATSYYPFVTEKFLYSVLTRGLFLTYGQPGWHDYLHRYFGFKLYTNIFDYTFDYISNPVHRLVALMSMLSKFSVMSRLDWHDLYLLEQDNIEFNIDHFRSGGMLQHTQDNSNKRS